MAMAIPKPLFKYLHASRTIVQIFACNWMNIHAEQWTWQSHRAIIQGSLTGAWFKTLLKVYYSYYNGPSKLQRRIWQKYRGNMAFLITYYPTNADQQEIHVTDSSRTNWKEKCSGTASPSAEIQVAVYVGGCQVPGLKVAPVPVGSEVLLRE